VPFLKDVTFLDFPLSNSLATLLPPLGCWIVDKQGNKYLVKAICNLIKCRDSFAFLGVICTLM
jgi:hypothetical protein